jgi:extracellular elastinolytic metalloproteinase
MRRPLPILFLLLLALLMAGSLASGAANAAADQPTVSSNGFDPANRTPVTAERGEEIARTHLLNNANLYGVSREDLAHLRVDRNYADSITGARYVKFGQTVNGIRVFNGTVNVTILPSGTVLYVGNRAVAGLEKTANSATPIISQSDAIASAAADLGLRYTASTVTAVESLGGTEQEVRYSGGNLSLETIPVKLSYQPLPDGTLRLAWELNIYQRDALHWWNVRVDALTGDVLDKNDWVVSENWDALFPAN